MKLFIFDHMKKVGFIFICVVTVSCLFASSCSLDRRKITRTDTPTSGVAEIAVDESFAPVIQLQVNVFESLNPDATIIPVYTSEREAYEQFVNDSIRLVIGTRELTEAEIKKIEGRDQRIRSSKLAVDGIALIVNGSNPDSLISISDLRRIFTGEIDSWKKLYPTSSLDKISVVFDMPNSSMARYMKDSICGEKPFGENIIALTEDGFTSIHVGADMTANQKVIDYVASTPNSLGVIGVNWISNPRDTLNLSFINKIKVLSVSRAEKATIQNSYKPLPYQIALGQYPLTRNVHILISDVFGGLPSGFMHFSAGDQGQRIITKAGLLPATRPTRMMRVNPEL